MTLFVSPRQTEPNLNGIIAAGWTYYFYEPGTSTPKTVYADAGFTTARGTSVTSDANGRFPIIYINGSAKVVLKDALGVEQWTEDNYPGALGNASLVPTVATLGELQGKTTTGFTGGERVERKESTSDDGLKADYIFRAGDQSASVAAKTGNEWVVPTDRTADGSSGAWEAVSEQFFDPVAPAYLKTTSDVLNGLQVSVSRVLTRDQISDVANYSSSADLSAPIQELIDEFSSRQGGEIYFPLGGYNACLTVKSGVSLVAAESHPSANDTAARRVVLTGVNGGYDAIIDTPSTSNTEGSSIKGFLLKGLGAGVTMRGIIIRGGRKNFIKDCAFDNLSHQAIFQPTDGDPTWSAGTTINGTLSISNVFAQNCLLGTVSELMGVIHLDGTDGGLDWVEATGSLSALSSANRYKNAFYFGPNSADWDGHRLLGEFADSGFYIDGTRHRFGTLKSDNAFGHGVVIDGVDMSAAFLHVHRASQDADGVYNGIECTSNCRRLVLPSWRVDKQNTTTNRVQHAINETLSNADVNQKNNFGADYSAPAGDRTGLVFKASSLFGGSSFKHNHNTQLTISAGDTTPSVNAGTFFIYNSTTPVSITDFDDATPGQEITVTAIGNGGGNITIVDNSATSQTAKIQTASGGNVLLAQNQSIRLKNYSGYWVEIA